MSTKNPTKGATPTVDAGHGRGALWTLLILCGGVSWVLSVVHALQVADKIKGDTLVVNFVAILFGTAPVVVAGVLSHIIAKGDAHPFERVLTWTVLAGAMLLSVNAQAATVGPYTNEVLRWVFPLMLDVSTVIALNKLMSKGHVATPAVAKNEGVARDVATNVTMATDRDLASGRGQIPMAKNVSTPVANPAPVAMATTMASGQNGGHGHVATSPDDGQMATPMANGHVAKTVAMATTMATPDDGQMASGHLAMATPESDGHVAKPAPVAKPVAKKTTTSKAVTKPPAPRPAQDDDLSTKDKVRLALTRNPAMSVEDLAAAIDRSTRVARRLRVAILEEMASGHLATDKSTKLASGHVAKSVTIDLATGQKVANPASGHVAMATKLATSDDGQTAMATNMATLPDGQMATDMATPADGQNDGHGHEDTTDDGHDTDVATVTELATYSRVR